MNSRDQDNKMAAGEAVAGAVGVGELEKLLTNLRDVDRKITIGINNETGFKWEALSVYFDSGTSDVILPEYVLSGQAALYGARKTAGPVATGAVGVLSYYIADLDKTLAIMFSVPFDYNLYDNLWNIKLFSGKKRADYDMHKNLYHGTDRFKGDDSWYERNLNSSCKIRGAMSSSGKATLNVSVRKL